MKNPNSHLFNFCPRCGEKNFTAVNKKSFQCAECRFNFYLNCAAAAIALIFTPDNKLLVTRRKYEPAKGSLDFPGGFADPGETIEECLVREIKEELNLDVTKLTYICSVPNTYQFKDVTYDITDFIFACKVENFDHILAADDICDFEFIFPDLLDKNKFGLDSVKKVIDMVRANDF
ncbi:MAG: NUDIX domain-containing protein [Desulfobacula sp.]|nr:NUDIX domain-containing protein [Desulfobacula sp.]